MLLCRLLVATWSSSLGIKPPLCGEWCARLAKWSTCRAEWCSRAVMKCVYACYIGGVALLGGLTAVVI